METIPILLLVVALLLMIFIIFLVVYYRKVIPFPLYPRYSYPGIIPKPTTEDFDELLEDL